jgi:hypothetical protein
MRGYTLIDDDLTRTLQQGIDKTVEEYPSSAAPEGFTWRALVKQVEDKNDTYTYVIEWVAKPNGK